MKIHNVWLSFLNYSSAPHKYSTSDLEEVWLSTEGWCNIKALKLNTSPPQKISLNYVYIFFLFWGHLVFIFSRALFFRFFPFGGPCFSFFPGPCFSDFFPFGGPCFSLFFEGGVQCCVEWSVGTFCQLMHPEIGSCYKTHTQLLQYTLHTTNCVTFYCAETKVKSSKNSRSGATQVHYYSILF